MRMTMNCVVSVLAVLCAAGLAQPASAQISLTKLVVELDQKTHPREDVEVRNDSSDVAYVSVTPSEIVDPGSSSETRVSRADPANLGLLVAPSRLILQPGQRRLIRFASLARGVRERVYRVTVKPVVGTLSVEQSGLKLLVGYDVLVLVRPAAPQPNVIGSWSTGVLTIRNTGNASVELTDGKMCDAPGINCTKLPGKRLYAGAEWAQKFPDAKPVEYSISGPGRTHAVRILP